MCGLKYAPAQPASGEKASWGFSTYNCLAGERILMMQKLKDNYILVCTLIWKVPTKSVCIKIRTKRLPPDLDTFSPCKIYSCFKAAEVCSLLSFHHPSREATTNEETKNKNKKWRHIRSRIWKHYCLNYSCQRSPEVQKCQLSILLACYSNWCSSSLFHTGPPSILHNRYNMA